MIAVGKSGFDRLSLVLNLWEQLPLADHFRCLLPSINIVKLICLSISGCIPTAHGCEIFELI